MATIISFRGSPRIAVQMPFILTDRVKWVNLKSLKGMR
jgi:hypothetical protein